MAAVADPKPSAAAGRPPEVPRAYINARNEVMIRGAQNNTKAFTLKVDGMELSQETKRKLINSVFTNKLVIELTTTCYLHLFETVNIEFQQGTVGYRDVCFTAGLETDPQQWSVAKIDYKDRVGQKIEVTEWRGLSLIYEAAKNVQKNAECINGIFNEVHRQRNQKSHTLTMQLI